MFISKLPDGSIKQYGTTNMTDHMKTCYSSLGKQLTMTGFMKRVPGKKFSDTKRRTVKEAEVRLVVEEGTSFAIVENNGLRAFAQLMIEIGSKHGNINIDDVLYGRDTVRDSVFTKMKECQSIIKKEIAASSKHNAVSFCTDMATDVINKNSYSDFTVFWINEDWKLRHAMYKCEQFPKRKQDKISKNLLMELSQN